MNIRPSSAGTVGAYVPPYPPGRLEAFAQRCWVDRPARYVLFAVATLISLLFAGYYFGTFDQAIHIPFLKKYADPSLYPNDPFFEMRFVHYSYFWFPFISLYQLGILEISMFFVHLIASYATFWAIWELSKVIFNNPLASLLAVIGFTLPHAGFASFTLIEFSLLNRTFVLPFLLFALTLYLRGRTITAFALFGILYNLHVVSVNFVLAMVLFDSLLQIRKRGWKTPLLGLLVFIPLALPVLIWRATAAPIAQEVNHEWFGLLANSYFYHLFYLIGPYLHVMTVTLGGFATIAIFFLTRSIAPVGYRASLTNFVYAALLIVLVQVLASYIYPMTILIQAQIMRAGMFVMFFAYLCFAAYLAQRFQTRQLRVPEFSLLTAGMITSISPLSLLAVWGALQLRVPRVVRRTLASVTLLATFMLTLTILYVAEIWRPGVEIYPRETAWTRTQLWARDNTPRDAVFITPPERWWFYEPEWRVLSERSTVVTLSELLEIAFEPNYTERWKERFDVLAPGVREQLRGDVMENNRLTKDAYHQLSTADFQAAAERFGASYLVLEKPQRRDFPIVYENEEFTIYQVR
jgi:hypothetical protein